MAGGGRGGEGGGVPVLSELALLDDLAAEVEVLVFFGVWVWGGGRRFGCWLGHGLGGRGGLCYGHCGSGGLYILWARFDKLVVLKLSKWKRETRG